MTICFCFWCLCLEFLGCVSGIFSAYQAPPVRTAYVPLAPRPQHFFMINNTNIFRMYDILIPLNWDQSDLKPGGKWYPQQLIPNIPKTKLSKQSTKKKNKHCHKNVSLMSSSSIFDVKLIVWCLKRKTVGIANFSFLQLHNQTVGQNHCWN